MRRAVPALALLVMLAGCKDKPETTPSAAKPAVFAGTDGMELAPSTTTKPAPDAATWTQRVIVYTAAHGLMLDGRVILPPSPDPGHGFEAKDKRIGINDLVIVPLQTAIVEKKSRGALLAFEPATPYRIVAEVAFTLGENDYDSIDLLVQAGGERRVIAMPIPRVVLPCGETLVDAEHDLAVLNSIFGDAAAPMPVAGVPLASRTPICIGIDSSPDGVRVRSRRDRLAMSCTEIARIEEGFVPTLPASTDGKLPLAEVQRCASTIKAKFPQSAGTRVTVSATGATPWRDVVAMMDAFGPGAGFGDAVLAGPK